MVYKKYIKRNGKLYGPYVYHSRRVNGKVISEYRGVKKIDNKKFIFLAIGILALFILFFLSFRGKITGNTISDSGLNSQIGNSLEENIIHPVVYFTLISKKIQNDNMDEIKKEQNDETDFSTTDQSNESQISDNQSNIENISDVEENQSVIANFNNSEENITEESQAQQNESEETSIEEIPPEQSTNNSTQESPSKDSAANDSEEALEQTPEETEPEQSSIPQETTEISEQPTEQPSTSESDIEPPSEQQSEETTSDTIESTSDNVETKPTPETNSEEESNAPITGGVISRFFKAISNFFLGLLSPTGSVVSEPVITEINGEVSVDNPFIYNLNKNESVELLSGSVKTDSKSLSDKVIQITYEGNQVLVSTNYSEISNVIINQTNETAMINETIIENFNVVPLTDEEKDILISEFGNSSVQIVKSELFNGRYVIKYQIGDYWIEKTYDSGLDNETLKSQMEQDKIKWLRDIINELSKEEVTAVPVDFS